MSKPARRKAQQQKKKNSFSLWGILALLVLAAAAVWFVSRSTNGTDSYPLEISVTDARAKQDAGAFILDVRQPQEWNVAD